MWISLTSVFGDRILWLQWFLSFPRLKQYSLDIEYSTLIQNPLQLLRMELVTQVKWRYLREHLIFFQTPVWVINLFGLKSMSVSLLFWCLPLVLKGLTVLAFSLAEPGFRWIGAVCAFSVPVSGYPHPGQGSTVCWDPEGPTACRA